MGNLSQKRRAEMLEYLNHLKEIHTDDESRIALSKIETALTEKKYGLVWEEHEEEVDKKLVHNIPVFKEVEERKIVADENAYFNFLLEGDNLHSLKLLEKTHKGKIDVIYIDPPYNTGNKDFIYDDNYIGTDDGYRHSKWLSFMNERLALAKELLSDSGYIFVSINNHEVAQLKLLLDTLFGEENFIGNITWESTTQPINAGAARFQLQQKCEYILVYCKDMRKKSLFILEEQKIEFKYNHDGAFGKCRFEIIEKSDSGQYQRDSMKFKILNQYPREGKRWQIGEELARQLEKDGKVEVIDGLVKRAFYPEDDADRVRIKPFWSHYTAKDVGTAQNGKAELNKIIGKPVGFDTVKPLSLMKNILSLFKHQAIVLDFFAGSGTTGHAVMQLNKEDGGDRKYILCTNNENNICEKITYQRMKNIQEDLPHNLKYYKTEFIPKLSEDEEILSSKLLDYIKEMVELENMCEIDGDSRRIILSDEDLNIALSEMEEGGALYIPSFILLTNEIKDSIEERKLEVITIPDYYFTEELREVNEL